MLNQCSTLLIVSFQHFLVHVKHYTFLQVSLISFFLIEEKQKFVRLLIAALMSDSGEIFTQS